MSFLRTATGTLLGSAIERRLTGTHAHEQTSREKTKEWMGRYWIGPLAATHVGLQMLAWNMFEGNDKLQQAIVVAPTSALFAGILAGATIDRIFRNHEFVEKIFMAGAVGAIGVGGAYLAAATNSGDWSLGNLDHGILSTPIGAAIPELAAGLGGAGFGVAIGEAAYKDEPKVNFRQQES